VKVSFELNRLRLTAGLLTLLFLARISAFGASAVLAGWSDVGMHEIDGIDVSVYSMLPPYSTIHAQLISGGLLVTNATDISVTYQAIADASGSINTTSQGKGNFFQFAQSLYGASLAPDQGLAGFSMPGTANQPQPMSFDPMQNWFAAVGIPTTPYDDKGNKNYFPMMRLVASSNGVVLATTDIVLPITDEMDCRACHASGAQTQARPPEGWVWEVDPIRDYKLNILRSHDDHFLGTTAYSQTLSNAGYNAAGLVKTVTQDGKPISCTTCHASGAIQSIGLPGARPLTQLMHTKHSYVPHPTSGVNLTSMTNSKACLLCHAGSERQALRGVHHNTVNPDGTLAMQCQSCHGPMTAVGALSRTGWVDEPACQSCHTGTATSNAGALRYTSVFSAPGQARLAVDPTFATPTNTQTGGFVLFQQGQGHGGLNCAACHGSAHAELLSYQANDKVQSKEIQGQAGVLTSCNTCHPTQQTNSTGGPHGLHPVDSQWASNHQVGRTQCKACHGTDYRGTVLALAQADRTFNPHFWQGFETGCYTCHAGPDGTDTPITNVAPVVVNLPSSGVAGTPWTIPLQGSDTNGNALSFRVITPPIHGTVSVAGNMATYFPDTAFVGADSFTYASRDGFTDSNLGTVSLTVNSGPCSLNSSALVPTADFPNWPVPFRAVATLSGCSSPITYEWDFGDGGPHGTGTNVAHVYSVAADYNWTLTVSSGTATNATTGVLTISPTLGPPLTLTLIPMGFMVELLWPADNIPTSLETSVDLAQPYSWQLDFDPVSCDGYTNSTFILMTTDQQYFRLRRVP
jgi:PKD repeat protein